MKRVSLLFLAASFLLISGCAGDQKVRDELQRSEEAYKACIQANLDNPEKCKSLERRYRDELSPEIGP